jgi:hypothetical protein
MNIHSLLYYCCTFFIGFAWGILFREILHKIAIKSLMNEEKSKGKINANRKINSKRS